MAKTTCDTAAITFSSAPIALDMLADCGSACIVAAFTSSLFKASSAEAILPSRSTALTVAASSSASRCRPSGTLGSSLLGHCSDSCLCGPDGFRRCLGETQRIALLAEAAKRGPAVGLRRTGNGEKRAAEEKRR